MVWETLSLKDFSSNVFDTNDDYPSYYDRYLENFFHESLGPANDLLGTFGIGPKWLSDPATAKITVIIVEVWQWTPFMFLLLLAGLLSLPKEPWQLQLMEKCI